MTNTPQAENPAPETQDHISVKPLFLSLSFYLQLGSDLDFHEVLTDKSIVPSVLLNPARNIY